jgi:hypothetical protein
MARRKKTPFEVPDLSGIAKANPYIHQLLEDPRLRGNIQQAIEASRSAFERLSDGGAPIKALLDDKKVQNDVRTAVDAIRNAADALAAGPKKRARKGLTLGRGLIVITVGGAAALAGSEELRSKVLDALFGAEQEFEYTPPADAPPPAAAAPAPASGDGGEASTAGGTSTEPASTPPAGA